MSAPWTAAEAASDAVSKKQLITFLQEKADESFLSTHKLAGAANTIVKRVTKDQLVEVYSKFTGGSGGGGAAPAASFSFANPSAADSSKPSPFNFATPAEPAAGAGDSQFTFNFSAPPDSKKGGGKKGGKPVPIGDDDDDDDDNLEEIDTEKMGRRGKGGGGGGGGGMMGIPPELAKRMEMMSMGAEERRNATVAELPKPVQRCVEKLEKLQTSVDVIQKEFDEKLRLLREEYDKKKAPFYKQRSDIVNASDGGVPGFWLGCLRNNMVTAEEIGPDDEEPLSYLSDIKSTTNLGAGKKGFQLAFVFKPNPYFEETMLTKTYLMDPDDDDECLTKAVGTDITWKEGKNITVKVIEKKQKKKGKVRTLKEEVPTESFFNFFDPPSVPEEDEEMDEEDVDQLHEQLENDFDVGQAIKDKIIPKAVSWFTGLAVDPEDDYDEDDDDDYDDEDEDDDDDDDDDDDEDDDESDDDGPPGKGGKGYGKGGGKGGKGGRGGGGGGGGGGRGGGGKGGGNPNDPECKQQ
jgi:nucleosome assembly protein 1-like 1